jgi:hypothetical protein
LSSFFFPYENTSWLCVIFSSSHRIMAFIYHMLQGGYITWWSFFSK